MGHTSFLNFIAILSGILLIMFATINPVHAAGFVAQISDTTVNLRGVHFSTATNGLAVGDGGVIRKTTNGGANWTASTSGTPIVLNDVFIAPDGNIAYAVGNNGVILKSNNSGATWSAQTSGTSLHFLSVHFSNATNGLAVGDDGIIRRTTNGGLTWSSSPSGVFAVLNDVFVIPNENIAYVVGNGGAVRKTTDLGATWSAQASGTSTNLNSVYFSGLNGWAVGSSGTIRHTTNGGLTWSSQTSGTAVHLSAVYFVDSQNGWIVGADGTVLRTINGGGVWNNVYSGGVTLPLLDVHFIDASIGWVVGNNGIILAYDAVAPTAPTSLSRISLPEDTTPSFLWSASTDVNGIDYYEVKIDSGPYTNIGTIIGTIITYTAPNPLSVGSHTIYVRAVDRAGNAGAEANLTFSITAPIDTTISSSPLSSTTSTSASFSFTSIEAVAFECRLDSGAYSYCSSPESYSGLAVGAHTFYVRAIDGDGNTDATPASYSWTITSLIDTTLPSAPTGLIRTTPDTDTTPTFIWNASTDNVGVTGYEFTLVGFGSELVNRITHTTSDLSVGSYTVSVRARDAAGNYSTTATLTFSITAPDTTAPDTTISSAPSSSTTSASASFSFTSTESGTFECRLDIGAYSSCASPKSYSGLAVGAHTFYVRAIDAAGNTDATPASYLWTITVETPATDIQAPSTPTGLTRATADPDNTPTFTWNLSTDNVGVVAYDVQMDSGTFSNIGGLTSYTSDALADGSHTFGVRARDAADNTSGVSSITFTITVPISETTPSTITTPIITTSGPPFSLEQMSTDASVVSQGSSNAVLSALGFSSAMVCQMGETDTTQRVDRVFPTINNAKVRAAIINFTACGTISTLHLGAGERLGVVNSFKSAFGRLPETTAHWNDIIKIGNGRFPGKISAQAESDAKIRFRTIYLHAPNMDQQNDKAAVTVMAYGLRPLPRNMKSEAAAISIYKNIFGKTPFSAIEWDALRAIAYSGAVR